MLSKDQSRENGLPEFPYGSVWLIAAGDGDQRHLSPLAVHALSTADAVIHDPGISEVILGLVKPPHYREEAAPLRAIKRVIKLTLDGWRVVHLFEGNAVERAIECAIGFAEHDIPFRIVANASEPIDSKAPLGLLLVGKPVSFGHADPRSSLVLLVATTEAEAVSGVEQRQPPLGFSMSGLAG
jgi:uroporphyrin-III C-methyltransferase